MIKLTILDEYKQPVSIDPNTELQSACSKYLSSRSQFRPINVQHDFSCSCPMSFTGTSISVICDTEFNLCYSNPINLVKMVYALVQSQVT
ncbi:unnamed protein product, partial [Brachionus calyciflorus]